MRKTTLLALAGTAILAEALVFPPSLVTTELQSTAHSQEAPAPAPPAAATGAPAEPIAQGTASAATPPAVDETALRYFARAGDTARLEAEIARLRSLYPDWTPPDDPLAIPDAGDPLLDRMWSLYAEGRYAEVREAIADRQSSETEWQPPADLLDRLSVAEARRRLVNASDLEQYDTVVRIGAETPSLLTCAEVDVLWRVARAFARTDRTNRALDAYRYILTNCDDAGERLATVQMASEDLDQADVDELLSLERENSEGVGEFEPIRLDLARSAVAEAGNDPDTIVPAPELQRLRDSADLSGSASDFLLLAWYGLTHGNPGQAERDFRQANEVEPSSDAARGLALALLALGRADEAEEVARPIAEESDDARRVYSAAAANLLSQLPPPMLDGDQLTRIVAVTAALQDSNTAQQLGWYSYSLNQFQTAEQWFEAALGWKSDEEPAAFGLALVHQRTGDLAALQSVQASWGARSPRIAQIGLVQGTAPAVQPGQGAAAQPAAAQPLAFQGTPPVQGAAAAAPQQVGQPTLAPATPLTQQTPAPTAAPPQTSVQTSPQSASAVAQDNTVERTVAQVSVAPPVARVQAPASAPSTGNCRTTVDPRTLTPETALGRGWCLMEIDRPLEAAPAFEMALLSRSEATRRDAAYGQSLAYLRVGQSDRAAVSATKAPQTRERQLELETALLTQQATDAFEAQRPVEALIALDARAAIAPERLDLMVLRGYAYLELRRYGDAERVFAAVARSGSREGARGINAVREARRQISTGG